jgi:uncharacterized membrane protein YhaH (DUF805 family)
MDIQKYFINPIRNNYTDFSGRATRKQYWMFELIYVIIFLVILIAESFARIPGILSTAFWLLTIVPALAFEVRRFRDAGFNPWWVLLYLIPVLGWIAVIVMHCQPSKH